MMPTNSDNDKFVWLILALLASARPVMIRIGGDARVAAGALHTLLPRATVRGVPADPGNAPRVSR